MYSIVAGNNGAFKYAPVAFVTYRPSWGIDTNESRIKVRGVTDTVQNNIDDRKYVELDVVCSGPDAPKGSGRLLCAYAIARAAQQKVKGAYRFSGAILDLAGKGGPQDRMAKTAQSLGFQIKTVDVLKRISDSNSNSNSNNGTNNSNRMPKMLPLNNYTNSHEPPKKYAILSGANDTWLHGIENSLPKVPEICTVAGSAKCH